jgi:adenylyl cyclase-associated protein
MNILDASGADMAIMAYLVYLPESCSDQVANWIKRLEAATARLEDIASSTVELPQGVPALKETLATPQSGIIATSTPAPAAPPPPAPEPVPESIEEFDNFVNTTVQKYAKLSKSLGGLLAEQVCPVRQLPYLTAC